jgi:putative salt-induced outer membrane protein
MPKTNKILIVFFLIPIIGFSLFAEEEKAEEPKWSGDASLGLALARGNTETTNFSLSFSLKGILSPKLKWVNTGVFLLGKADGITNAESIQLGTRLDWKFSERFFSFFEIQGIRDRFKNYDYRILPGLGAGYTVVAAETTSLSVTGGLSQVFTKYWDPGDTDSHTGLTFGNEWSWKISPTSELKQKASLLFDVSEMSHYFARLEINLASAIAKGLAVKLSLIDLYDNNPVGEGVKKNDVAFLAGLSAKF